MAVNSGSTILPGGASSAGTLNMGALTLNTGSQLNYDFFPTAGSVDLINVANTLTINGGSVGLYGTNGSSQLTTPGTYPLIDFNSLTGLATSLSVLNPSPSLIYAFSTSGNTLDVTVQQGNVWTGGSLGPTYTWSNGANWGSGLAPTGGTVAYFAGTTGLTNSNDITGLNLPGITFVPGAGAFNISGNSIQLSGPITNNSTSVQTIALAISLTGNQTITAASGNIVLAGAISDAGSGYGITTAGANTVTLSAANTFSGATTISAGRLDLANGLALQNSTLTYSAGSLLFDPSVSPAAFTLGGLQGTSNISLATNITGVPVTLTVGNNNSTTAYGGALSGPGSLTKAGTGTLTLNAANTFTGNTLVSAGVLQLGVGERPAKQHPGHQRHGPDQLRHADLRYPGRADQQQPGQSGHPLAGEQLRWGDHALRGQQRPQQRVLGEHHRWRPQLPEPAHQDRRRPAGPCRHQQLQRRDDHLGRHAAVPGLLHVREYRAQYAQRRYDRNVGGRLVRPR